MGLAARSGPGTSKLSNVTEAEIPPSSDAALPPRGSVLFVEEESGRATRYVLLTDLRQPQVEKDMPLMGVVPLAQKHLPDSVLYPIIVGNTATGLAGTWRARADKIVSVFAKRFRAAGTVTALELEAIDAAARAFLAL